MPKNALLKTGEQLAGEPPTDFVPQLCLISNVDISTQANVTTVTPHGYITGQLIKIFVPPTYLMNILQNTLIIVTGNNTFQTTINTTAQQNFTTPTYPPIAFTPAQAVPITGETRNIAPK